MIEAKELVELREEDVLEMHGDIIKEYGGDNPYLDSSQYSPMQGRMRLKKVLANQFELYNKKV